MEFSTFNIVQDSTYTLTQVSELCRIAMNLTNVTFLTRTMDTFRNPTPPKYSTANLEALPSHVIVLKFTGSQEIFIEIICSMGILILWLSQNGQVLASKVLMFTCTPRQLLRWETA